MKCTTWGHLFSVWRHGFFALRDVHSQHVYLQEESLPPFSSLSCRMHLKNRFEFVLIVFYLQLINSGHADSSMEDKKHGKLSSRRETRCEWTSRNTKKLWRHTWCISMYHVIGLKHPRSIKNVTLKMVKNFVSKISHFFKLKYCLKSFSQDCGVSRDFTEANSTKESK